MRKIKRLVKSMREKPDSEHEKNKVSEKEREK